MEKTEKMIQLTEIISYKKATREPLCADIGIIRGKEKLWLYDVGTGDEARLKIRRLQEEAGQDLSVVLSHFHPDHTGNLLQLLEEFTTESALYVGENTYKYTQTGIVVKEDLYIEDGEEFHLFPLPSCHAKGSLGLEISGEYAFLGDGIYSTQKGGRRVYNAQLLLEEIRVLKALRAETFLLSHRDPMMVKKETVIAWLEQIYAGREKGNAYIEAAENFC